MIERKSIQNIFSPRRLWVRVPSVILILVWLLHPPAFGAENNVFRTGLFNVKSGTVAVTPDGRALVFTTSHMPDGFRHLDLQTGQIRIINQNSRRFWHNPRWSHDGRQLVVVSAGIDPRGLYQLNDTQIAVINPQTWESRNLTHGHGVRSFPFFSNDGQKVYYFHAQLRERGRTPANKFDLYAIDLKTGNQERLTDEEFYMAMPGDVNRQGDVIFSAYVPSKHIPASNKKDSWGLDSHDLALKFNPITRGISQFSILSDGRAEYQFYGFRLDAAGNMYSRAPIANKSPFIYAIWKMNSLGGNIKQLNRININYNFDVAWHTGDVLMMDRTSEGELIFRKLFH
ncbi:protein TolB [mine drainage metagenome]|uniref:Protein TolB n=1 Tax=mine drainage metagenome TaxID=410659 RepID=A0A1J5QZR3_9ZZZZ